MGTIMRYYQTGSAVIRQAILTRGLDANVQGAALMTT